MPKFDWEKVRKRAQEAEKALDGHWSIDPKRSEEILRRRAAQLAGRKKPERDAGSDIPAMVFWLGKERYAAAAPDLTGVVLYQKSTPVPVAPFGVLSVINVRGEIVTVYSLKKLLGLAEGPMTQEQGSVLLLRHESLKAGVHVDRAEGTVGIRPQELMAPGGKETNLPMQFVRGFTKDKLMVLEISVLVKEKILGQR